MKQGLRFIIGLVIGVCLIVVGINMNGVKQISKIIPVTSDVIMSPEKMEDQTITYAHSMKRIDIDVYNADISFEESDHDQVVVKATNLYTGFTLDSDQLKIQQPHYWDSSFTKAKIVIQVPRHYSAEDVRLHVNAGDVTVDFNEVELENCDISVNMGDLDIENLIVLKRLTTSCNMGDLDVELKDKIENYQYDVKVNMGDAKVGHFKADGLSESMHSTQGHKQLNVDCSMGSININTEDE